MILYITRHGQPALDGMPAGADYELPDGDYPLSCLGREQAEFLGKQLKKENFDGMIVSSPYARTMETAAIVSTICGVTVTPEPRFQELLFFPVPLCPGLTLEEMRKYYGSAIAPDAVLKHPWIIQKGPEDPEIVYNRVTPFMDELLAARPAGKLLLVGHGASVSAAVRYLCQKAGFTGDPGYAWNAALGSFEISPEGSVKLISPLNCDHIPREKVTSNRRTYDEVMSE